MYSGGGSFPSLHKCSTRALLALKAYYQGSLHPWVQGLHFSPGPDTQVLPGCAVGTPWLHPTPCCPFSFSGSQPLLVLLTGPPGWNLDTINHITLSGAVVGPCYQLCPCSCDAAGLCPGWGGYCLCWGHCQHTACTPHSAGPLLTLTTTATWQRTTLQCSLSSEMLPVKYSGMFALLTLVSSGNNSRNSSEIHEWSVI